MKKNILFINGHLNCGGVERSLVDILRKFDYSKYNVDLLLLEEYGDYLSEIPSEVNIKLIDLHNTYGSVLESIIRCLRKKDFVSLYLRIIFVITKFFGINKLSIAKKIFTNNKHYDLAIGFRTGICMNIAAFAVDSIKSVGWWHHGEYSLSKTETTDFIISTNKLDNIICVSKACETMLSNLFPEFSNKFIVINNMVDISKIKSNSMIPFDYVIDNSLVNILTVGRLVPEKHVENVIYSAKSLIENGYTEFKWHIVGDGEQKEFLVGLVNKYNLSRYITFYGNQQNPYAFMNSCDILVHTSYIESQCLVALEAMAVGIPSVITRSLGPEEFAVDGVNCIFVEPDVESLIKGIVKMINISDKSDMIASAYETVKQYSPDRIMEKIYNI